MDNHKAVDPRIEKTKLTLQEGLCDILLEKPLDQISVSELSHRAKINRSTFYLHYTNINELYLELKNNLLNEYKKTLQIFSIKFNTSQYLNEESKKHQVEFDLLNSTFQFIKANKKYAPIILAKGYGDQILNEFVSLGEEIFLKDLHLQRNKVFPGEEFAYFTYIAHGIIAIIQTWVKGGMQEKTEEMAKMIIRFIY